VVYVDNGKKCLFYVILCDPIPGSGLFLTVTFTDAMLYDNPWLWKVGTKITPAWPLEKDSVLHIHPVRMRDQSWLDESCRKAVGTCSERNLKLIVCNLCLLHDRIDPYDKAIFERYREEWCTAECDDI